MIRSSRSKASAYAKRFQELKADLAQIEYFSKGTLLARMVRCGKPQCACGKDPSKRHGPYYEWSYKARGKTVTVRLAPEAAPFFRAAARQYRKLKAILNRMETLSRQALAKLAKDPTSHPSTRAKPREIFISRSLASLPGSPTGRKPQICDQLRVVAT